MSVSTAAEHQVNARRPLSLRELFCLTTVAAVTVAVVLHREWTTDERWLLALSLGGSLVGVLVARLFGRRGWIGDVLVGMIGALVAVGIIGQQWLDAYRTEIQSGPPEEIVSERQYWLAVIGATLLVGLTLAVGGTLAYRLTVWITDLDQRGLIGIIRRYPLRSSAWAVAIALFALGIWQIDFLCAPFAWTPRYYILFGPNDDLDRRVSWRVMDGTAPRAHLGLSHQGGWLVVHGRERSDDTIDGKLYHLGESAQLMDEIALVGSCAFRSDTDELICLVDDPEVRRQRNSNVHIDIIDPHTGHRRSLPSIRIKGYPWDVYTLADNSLVVDHLGSYTRIVNDCGQWIAQPSENYFSPRSGYSSRGDRAGIHIVDPMSSREVATWPRALVDELRQDVSYGADLISRNGRFGMCVNVLFDLESKQRIAQLDTSDERSALPLWMTNRGHVITLGRPYEPYLGDWLDWVPLLSRWREWMLRFQVFVIDPATGREVARTQPLIHDLPHDLALSHDGSRMAFMHKNGVYVYDIPPEFR